MNYVNIRDFGAVGDGITLDTEAVQKAFDTVAEAGGGKVLIPPGKYLVANLKLRDNLTIHLENGAILQGPDKSEFYETDETVNPKFLKHYMISGTNVHNVVIEGNGVIDNAGDNFWIKELGFGYFQYPVYKPKPNRPVALYMMNCSNVTLQNFRIHNGAAYTVWLLGCKDVFIHGLTIRNDVHGPNTDALDIDCCSNVRISDCDIEAGDDCIALKSDIGRLKNPDAVCERIVVSNCIFSSQTCAIRIGYEGDGPIRDCIFSGLVCYRCRKVIAMQSLVVRDPTQKNTCMDKGTAIENMIFSDFVLRDVDRAFFMRAGCDEIDPGYVGYIRNITISNIRGNVLKESFIGGTSGYYVSGIRMDRINLQRTGTEKSSAGEVPQIWGHNNFPQATFALRYIRDIRMNHMEITGETPMLWQFVQDGWLEGKSMPEHKN